LKEANIERARIIENKEKEERDGRRKQQVCPSSQEKITAVTL